MSANLEQDRRLARETTCFEKKHKLPDGTNIMVFYLINKIFDNIRLCII